MYEVDDQDSVSELSEAPKPDVGAPLPAVIASEHTLYLVYLVSDVDPGWDGTSISVVGLDSARDLVATICFNRPYAHMFGPPNDEAFSGHPSASRGLASYAVWEIAGSSWIRHLERMNAVHPYHKPSSFESLRHFVFAFHDSTFECVARSFTAAVRRGSIREAVEECSGELA